jgi:iron complex transport system substrate-binding protein
MTMQHTISITESTLMRFILTVFLMLALAGTTVVSAAGDAGTSTTLGNARIVSLGSIITETLVALGEEKRLVGVDATSVYPASVKAIPQVGYHRQLAAEGVLSLKPTLVLGTTDAGPAHALDQIRGAGVSVVLIPSKDTAESARQVMAEVGRLVGRDADAQAILARIDKQLADVQARTASATKPRVLFIYARGGGTLNVAGSRTKADEVIRLAGGINAFGDQDGYKPLTSEGVVAGRPDVVFVLEGGFQALGGEAGILAIPGISLTPAGQKRRIIHLDDSLALGFGPRLGDGVVALASQLHPDAMKGAE